MVTNIRRIGLTACAAVVLVVGAVAAAPGQASADDGWRRTAHGWEHLSPPLFIVTEPKGSTPLHPLLFAALQVALIAGAYWRMPAARAVSTARPSSP